MKIQSDYIELDILKTQKYIKIIKDNFEKQLAKYLNLIRVSAPILVTKNSGLQDDLSGKERKVSFDLLKDGNEVEIVQSLAKWKRYALKKYSIPLNEGIYTDMLAIRRDDKIDNIHSIYVDQWDWEKVISKENRNVDFLKNTVRAICKALKKTSKLINRKTKIKFIDINEDVHFITSQELLDLYPNMTDKEREYEITKKYKTVFIIGIGNNLSNGEPHDLRAPDYDDWNLNGDLLIYHNALDIALEISSMGIRVDKQAMLTQIEKSNTQERLSLPFHQGVINEELPLSIGGGIGQSRLCMLLLNRKHIGQVQSSYWDKENLEYCQKHNIELL